MIKKNEYYATVYGRMNNLKQAFLGFFFGISSYPRLLIEVFLRRDMGISYFSLFHCICWAIFLFVLPFLMQGRHGNSWHQVLTSHWAWYVFFIAFCKFAWDRHKECKRPYGYYDFNHFSKSSGKRLDQVDRFKFRGKPLHMPYLDIYLEPLLATAVGLLALLLGQGMLSVLLIVCAGIYSLSYMAAYSMGRDRILEDIDKSIANRWITDTFLNDKPNPTNFDFFGPKPSSEDIRNGLADLLGDDDDGTEVA